MLQFKTILAWLTSDEYSKKLFLKICVRPSSKRVILISHISVYSKYLSTLNIFEIFEETFRIMSIIHDGAFL